MPSSAVLLSLWYIFQLPVSPESVIFPQDLARNRFRSLLLGDGPVSVEDRILKMFVVGLMLSDKWMNDHTFITKTWCALLP